METTQTQDTPKELKSAQGWIRRISKVKGRVFVFVYSAGQVEYQLTLDETSKYTYEDLSIGASFQATGYDSVTPRGMYEMVVKELIITGKSDGTYPIQPKWHSDEYLRTIPEHRGRTKKYQTILMARHVLSQKVHDFFKIFGFTQYFAPMIIDSDCEGAGETFQVKSEWLDKMLTVSSQLHGEVGMMALEKIYTFSPCFRAEKSATKKHLAEFWMIEPEMAFYDLDKTIQMCEYFIKYLISTTYAEMPDELHALDSERYQFAQDITTKDWKVITYTEVAKKFKITWGEDISSEKEKEIVEHYKCPVFITHYPKELKPFYMLKDDKVAYCFDLIFPVVGELVGGSQREHDYDKLKQAMVDGGLDLKKMDWYLQTRQYGSVIHSGFGVGFERLVMFITGAEKVHDTIPFPVSF